MDDKPFTPLRIRAYLQAPIVTDAFLPLDGVLYYHEVRRKLGPQEFTLPGESRVREGYAIHLPFLKRNKMGDDWYYACSFAQWPTNTVEAKDYWNKTFDDKYANIIDFQGKRAKIDITRGKYKAYRTPIQYRHALYVDWYCVGNRENIYKLLRFCTHLGKKTSQGWGAVLRWEVIDWPENWSTKGPRGERMRAIPSNKGNAVHGIRPSYWNPRHQFKCFLPNL